MTATNYALIPQRDALQVLMLEQDGIWTLPHCTQDGTMAMNREMQAQLGLTTTVLYCLSEQNVAAEDGEEAWQRLYVLENHADAVLPAQARWLQQEELADLNLALPEQRSLLENWFAEQQGGEVEKRRSWARTGWYSGVLTWLRAQLEQLGYEDDARIEQYEVSDWSCILCVFTQRGTLYLKCCDPEFGHEPQLTQALGQLWSATVPKVLAINSEQVWMLMEDAGKLLTEDKERAASLASWQDILRRYARMQIAALEHLPFLFERGCPDRRLYRLPEIFEHALADTKMLLLGEPDGLSEEEYTRALAFAAALPALCSKLASFNIPETLHHDDLHGGNILVQGDNYIFFDWAESFIAHPFYVMVIVQRFTRYVYEYDDAQFALLRDTYLNEWLAYGSIEQLREALEHALQLGKVCRALTWYQYTHDLEPRVYRQYRDVWPAWVKIALGIQA